MKTFQFLFLFLIFGGVSYAQSDYRLFRPDVQYLYHYEEADQYAESRYIGMKLGDSLCGPTYTSLKYYGNYECSRFAPSFAGYVVCQNSTESYLQIDSNTVLTIFHLAPVAAEWLTAQIADTLIFARVTRIENGVFLGITDSLKTITFQTQDLSGNPIQTAIDGKSIIISKQYGLVQALWFRDFPSVGYKLPIAGISQPEAGLQNISTDDIFDLSFGDELHIRNSYFAYPNFYTRLSIFNITNRVFDPEENQILISYDEQAYSVKSGPQSDTVLTEGLGTWVFDLDQLEYLDKQPGEFTDLFGDGSAFIMVALEGPFFCQLNGKNHMHLFLLDQLSGCLMPMPDAWPGSYFVEGAAGNYYTSLWGDGSGRVLKYVRKGELSCGTPYDFSGPVISTGEPSELSIKIWPNPVSGGRLHLDIRAEYLPLILEMHDATSREVLKIEVESPIFQLDISALQAGIYFLELFDHNNRRISRSRVVVFENR